VATPLLEHLPLYEQTVRRPVQVRGIGLHSGVPVTVTLRPAPPGTGLVFVRKDLEDFEIPAHWSHVARVSYATSLMRKGVLISTVEHLLSVCYALGIDNARIEIDNLEVPVLDGSGLPWLELILEAGIQASHRPRQYLRILRTVAVEAQGRSVRVEPADTFRLTCDIFFDHPLIGRQRLELELTPAAYAREIAPARTFGFTRDLKTLREMGLIRGASLENAIGFDDTGVLNADGLRFPDECCRHKALDLIGDLALLGRPLLGHVIAERAGHAMHVALVSRIMANPWLYEVVTLERTTVAAGLVC